MPREYFSEKDYYTDDERISDARRKAQFENAQQRAQFNEAQGPGLNVTVPGIAGFAAVLGGLFILRKKVALSRSFSLNVSSLIEGGNKSVREVLVDRGYQKFIVPKPAEGNFLKRALTGTANLFETAVITPIPTAKEALTIAKLQTEKNLSEAARGLGLGKGSLPDMDAFWRHAQETTKSWGRFETLIYGPPAVSIAPRALLGAANKNLTSGAYGSVFLVRPTKKSLLGKGIGDIYRIHAKQSGLSAGELRSEISMLRDPSIREGVKAGSIYSSGERIETIKAGFEHISAKNRDEFARMIMPNTSEILHEQQRHILASQMIDIHRMSSFPLVKSDIKKATSQDIKNMMAFKVVGKKDINEMSLKELVLSHDYLVSKSPVKISRAQQILKLNADLAKERAKEAGDILHRQVLKAKSTGLRYWLYKLQTRLGIGQMYARKGAGVIPNALRNLFTKAELFGAVDPITKGRYPSFISHYELGLRKLSKTIPGKEYVIKKASIGGMAGGERGAWFVYPGKGSAKRFAIKALLEGTFIGAFEETTGLGVMRGGRASLGKMLTNKLGIGSGGYAEYGINVFTGVAKLAAVTAGLVYTYNVINSLAREATGGWGPTDIIAKGYTAAREFQQQVLSDLGVVGAAKELERSYPGSIKSPLATLGRFAAPAWGLALGGAIGSKISQPQLLASKNKFLNSLGLNLAKKNVKNLRQFGSRVGLAMGMAMALLLWGDITQSPEELHQIYSGEKEVPVRKGRWWMFGQTPFFGGKVQYYRPHWYPLMKSRYKYRGQLWDSESEEIMHSGLIGGALSTLTLGMWDPYFWEKKHYFDRPYPITAPLMEPMLPFAGLVNMSIGNIIKPRRIMHSSYFGVAQPGSEGPGYKQIGGASGTLGMTQYSPEGELPTISPGGLKWQITEELYTHAERLGLRGYILNAMIEKITGRPDFLPEGPILESAGRATGWERNYWDRDLGDPFFLTEFLRRVIPHRRRQIDEYNPIRNQMPDWLPGEDYFIDFQRGDPYVKIPVGEARLPGAGYESLHPLHSGVPGVYDAVDRFMVLSDVAPYSNEYRQYRALAIAATKKDDYWKSKVRTKIKQRSDINKEYDFLELEAPPAALPGSGAYRQLANLVTRTPNPFEAVPFFPFATNKWFPYKTAQTMYEDYMLYGDMFQPWADFPGAFVKPFFNKVVGRSMNLVGATYIPIGEQNRREYEDYFDRLKYIKYSTLANLSKSAGQKTLYNRMSEKARQTMVGVNAYGSWKDVFYAIPKKERAFYEEFALAGPDQRDKISATVSPQMRRIYEARWGVSGRGQENQEDMEEYFKNHYLPPSEWIGWNPDVDLGDVQLKTVRNEGMDIHAFNLWQSQERELSRKPYVPVIDDIHQHTKNYSMIQRSMERNLVEREFGRARVNIVSSSSAQDSVRIRVNIRKKRQVNAADMLAVYAGIQ